MCFREVDLPQAVMDAQERGELVFFAGAGVSIKSDAPQLPSEVSGNMLHGSVIWTISFVTAASS